MIDSDSKLYTLQNIVLPLTFRLIVEAFMSSCRSDAINFAKKHDVYPNLYDGINLRKTDVDDVIYRKLDSPAYLKVLKPIHKDSSTLKRLDAKKLNP